MMRVWYVFCFFFLSLTPHLWADVPNGGFEQITASQMPVNWSPVPDSTRVMVERERAHSGEISALMLGGTAGRTHHTDRRSHRYSSGSRLCLNRMGVCRQRKGFRTHPMVVRRSDASGRKRDNNRRNKRVVDAMGRNLCRTHKSRVCACDLSHGRKRSGF